MRSPDPRLTVAVGAGKLVGAGSRRLRLGGGTTLPGDVARALDPQVLAKLSRSLAQGTVLVTGTNGKTSTAAMLRTILSGCGWRVGGNPSGSNLIYGLTAAALQQAGWDGRLGLDWLVLEVDELSAPRAVAETGARGLVVLNAFRDQLDRSFEVDQISRRLARAVAGLAPAGFWVGNADDPRVAAIGEGDSLPRRVLFGLDDPSVARGGLPPVADARVCPRCGGELDFELVFYAHCGIYRCRRCDFSRPRPQIRAGHIVPQGLDRLGLTLTGAGGETTPVSVALGGIYQAANVAAAFATATELGVGPGQAASGLASFRPAFGRSQVVAWGRSQVRLLLAKNPAGLEESLTSVLELERSPVLALALNDGVADGRDISWIWDVDLERLAGRPELRVVVSGTRSRDLALRLCYAGVDSNRVLVRPQPLPALETLAELARPGVPAPALLTYTAMLAWHRLLVRSGEAAPFWTPN